MKSWCRVRERFGSALQASPVCNAMQDVLHACMRQELLMAAAFAKDSLELCNTTKHLLHLVYCCWTTPWHARTGKLRYLHSSPLAVPLCQLLHDSEREHLRACMQFYAPRVNSSSCDVAAHQRYSCAKQTTSHSYSCHCHDHHQCLMLLCHWFWFCSAAVAALCAHLTISRLPGKNPTAPHPHEPWPCLFGTRTLSDTPLPMMQRLSAARHSLACVPEPAAAAVLPICSALSTDWRSCCAANKCKHTTWIGDKRGTITVLQ